MRLSCDFAGLGFKARKSREGCGSMLYDWVLLVNCELVLWSIQKNSSARVIELAHFEIPGDK